MQKVTLCTWMVRHAGRGNQTLYKWRTTIREGSPANVFRILPLFNVDAMYVSCTDEGTVTTV